MRAKVASVVAVAALGAFGLAFPGARLAGGIAWLVALFAALAGWGHALGRALRLPDAGLGTLASRGVVAYVAIAGPLVALGVFARPVVLAAIALGWAGFAWCEASRTRPALVRCADAVRTLRARPWLAFAVAALCLVVGYEVLGAIVDRAHSIPDDDIIYTPLLRRLLDAGNLIEPYSFRRLGAYGGHTALEALAGARGTLANLHLLDKGLMFAIAVLAVAEHGRERKTSASWLVETIAALVLLPGRSGNAASHWSGVVTFFALYTALAGEQWTLAGLCAAATCTLRQSFLLPVALLVGVVLLARRPSRGAWLRVCGATLAALLPWLVATMRSSHTFLFPLVGGTFTPGLSLRFSSGWPADFAYFVTAVLEPSPIAVVPPLFAVLAVLRDRRPGAPLRALFVATALSFAYLTYSFVGSGSVANVWRYAFGFAIALTAALAIEAGARDAKIELSRLARCLLIACLFAQLAAQAPGAAKRFDAIAHDLAATPADSDDARYAAMQAAIPSGATVAVMLDDASHLDFARNAIVNLDTVGFASPDGAWPAFQGAEPIRAYLVAHGVRYLAFVRADRSRQVYRRDHWLHRLFTEDGFFAVKAAYSIDAIDNFAELATTTAVVYDADGLVVLDLLRPLRRASARPALPTEHARRDAFVRDVAARAGMPAPEVP